MTAPQTTATQYASADFSANAFAAFPPALTSLSSVVFPRLSPSPANLVAGGPAITNIGTGPALQTGWGNFTETTAAYDSHVVDSVAGTLIAVAQAPGGNGGLTLFSNLIPSGIDFYLDNFGNGVGVNVTSSLTGFEIPVPGGSIMNWGFYALTWGAAGVTFNAPTVGLAYNLASASAGGTAANAATISATATGSFAGSPHTVTYTLNGSDTLNTAVAALAAAINADSVMQAAGISSAAFTNKIGFMFPAGAGYTFSTGNTGSTTLTYTNPTSAHAVNAAQTYKVGSTVSGVGQGTGSIAAWCAANAQATQAQIALWYKAWRASLASVGIAL